MGFATVPGMIVLSQIQFRTYLRPTPPLFRGVGGVPCRRGSVSTPFLREERNGYSAVPFVKFKPPTKGSRL